MREWASKEILGHGLTCSAFALFLGMRPAFLWLFHDLMSRAFLCGGRSLIVGHYLLACSLYSPLAFIDHCLSFSLMMRDGYDTIPHDLRYGLRYGYGLLGP